MKTTEMELIATVQRTANASVLSLYNQKVFYIIAGYILVKNLYVLENFFTTSNQCIYTCRSCLQNISFVNLKPHPAELIN